MSGGGKVNATLYITRHGECAANAAQRFLEPFTDVLTEVGSAQAELLGKHLKDVPFTGAFASDYPRAEQTARAVLRESRASGSGVQLKIDARLRERGFTGITGVDAKDAINTMHEIMQKGTPYLHVEMKGCEAVSKFEERIIDFFSELIGNLQESTLEQETILVVSHGLTIQRLMVLLNTRPNMFGISQWTTSSISERQMRNTTYHKVSFEILKTSNGKVQVKGHVESPHCRNHIEKDSSNADKVKDTENYTYLEQTDRGASFEEETVHYCKPV